MSYEPTCPVPLPPRDVVQLGHGSGGRLTNQLVRDLFLPLFSDPALEQLGDAAVLDVEDTRLAFTTDSFVVSPAFFPGSDIGALSVNGTVNDLAMVGARPVALSAAFILEEGLPMEQLAAVATSMAHAARAAEVRLTTGDTKVVEHGGADGLFVTTSGLGLVPRDVDLGPHRVQAGDAVLVSGPVGSHGVAVLSRRAGVGFEVDVESDTAPLTGLVEAMLAAGEVHCLRDATRGGLATVLNEVVEPAGVRVTVEETAVPVVGPVRAACATLGLDPLYVANEGVCVVLVAAPDAENVLAAARAHPVGADAALIGTVEAGTHEPAGATVHLRTGLGATRPLLVLAGDQLPRIC